MKRLKIWLIVSCCLLLAAIPTYGIFEFFQIAEMPGGELLIASTQYDCEKICNHLKFQKPTAVLGHIQTLPGPVGTEVTARLLALRPHGRFVRQLSLHEKIWLTTNLSVVEEYREHAHTLEKHLFKAIAMHVKEEAKDEWLQEHLRRLNH